MYTHFAFFILDSILKSLYSKKTFLQELKHNIVCWFIFSQVFLFFDIFFLCKFKETIEEIKNIYKILLYVRSLKHNKNYSIKVKTKKVFSERDITITLKKVINSCLLGDSQMELGAIQLWHSKSNDVVRKNVKLLLMMIYITIIHFFFIKFIVFYYIFKWLQ